MLLPPYIDIDLRKASKVFAQHFSCGSSVTGEDEVVIQGDVWGDLVDFIPEKWPEVFTHFPVWNPIGMGNIDDYPLDFMIQLPV